MNDRIDPHYTPAWLADEVAAALPDTTRTVVDLAAGGGALLEAVERRFEALELVGAVDIHRGTVDKLRASRIGWVTSLGDALSDRSRASSSAFRQRPGAYDAAVLNPPFSYRGARRHLVRFADEQFEVTPATAFVLQALKWVKNGGTVVSILPANIMDLESDAEAWRHLRRSRNVSVVRKLGRNTFPGCKTSTWVVKIEGEGSVLVESPSEQVGWNSSTRLGRIGDCRCVEIVRGRVPVFRVADFRSDTGVPLVHSTDLLGGDTVPSKVRLASSLATVGPMLLIPRVGRPNTAKVSLFSEQSAVLSDCVIGLRSPDTSLHKKLQGKIIANFESFSALYGGSCAPYMTIARLSQWLTGEGYLAIRRPASSSVDLCSCGFEPSAMISVG